MGVVCVATTLPVGCQQLQCFAEIRQVSAIVPLDEKSLPARR